MKTNTKWLAVLLFLGSLISQSVCRTYVNDSQHYSISLMEKWEYIDQSALKQAESEAYARTGQMNQYTVGFKLIGTADFEYPYILVQEMERNSVSMKDVESNFQTEDVRKDLKSKYPGYRDARIPPKFAMLTLQMLEKGLLANYKCLNK